MEKVSKLLKDINVREYISSEVEDSEDTVATLDEMITDGFSEIISDDSDWRELRSAVKMANAFENSFKELYSVYPEAPSPTAIRVWIDELEDNYKHAISEGLLPTEDALKYLKRKLEEEHDFDEWFNTMSEVMNVEILDKIASTSGLGKWNDLSSEDAAMKFILQAEKTDLDTGVILNTPKHNGISHS